MRNIILSLFVSLLLASLSTAQEPPKKADDPEKILAALLKTVKGKGNANIDARAQAILDLGEFGPKAAPALPDLLDALQTKNEELRLNASITLAKIGKPAVTPVAGLLKDADPVTRFYAIWTLASIGPDATETVPAIIRAMADKDVEVRRKAAYALGRLAGDPARTIAVLTEAIKDESDEVRESAGEALAKFGKAAVPPLVVMLKSDKIKIRMQAATSLGEIGADAREAVPLLKDQLLAKDSATADHYAQVLAKIGKAALPALEAGFKDARPEVNQAASQAMTQLGADAVPFLVDALGDKKVELRRLAAQTLGPMQIGDKSVVIALAFALTDADESVRVLAVNALSNLGGQAKLASAKLKIALIDANISVAVQAFYLLQTCGEDPGPILKKSIKSKDAKTRLGAAHLMLAVQFDIDASLPVLADALKSDDRSVKMDAALALAAHQKHPDKVRPIFIDGLKDKSADMRMRCVTGLTNMRDTESAPALAAALRDPDENVRQLIINSLHGLRGNSNIVVPILAKVYKEGNDAVRSSVLQIVWTYGGPAKTDPAKSLLRTGLQEKSAEVRRQAVYALTRMQADRTDMMPSLVPLLKDPEVDIRRSLVGLLQSLGEPSAPHLAELLKDSDDVVRLGAAQTLNNLEPRGKALLEANAAQLAQVLKNPSEDIRFATATLLNEMGTRATKALPALKEAMKDPNAQVRTQAHRAVAKIGGEGALLVKHFQEEKYAEVRADLLAALATSADRKLALPLLKPAMKDPSELIRQSAVRTVFNFSKDSPECLEVFQMGLKDRNREVRVHAGHAGNHFGPKSWPALEEAFKTAQDDPSRYAILWSLHHTANRSKTLVPGLIDCLKDSDVNARQLACAVLLRIGPDAAAALPQLRELAKDSSNAEAQTAAKDAIKRIETEKK